MRPEPPSRVLIGRVSWLPVRQGGRERALWPPALLLCLCAAPPCWGTTAASPQTGLCSASPPKPDSAAKWCFRQSAECSGEGGGRCPSCPWSLPLRAVWAAAAAAVPVCPGVQPPCWAAGPAGPGAEAASRCLQQGGLQVCHLCCSGRREHLHLGGESGPPSLLPDPRAPSGRALRRRQGVWSAVPRRGDQSLSTSGPVRRTDGGRSWPAAARALPEAPVPTARPLRRAPCAPRVRLGRSTASVLPQLEAAVPGGGGGAGPHRTTQRGSQARPVRGSRASQGLQCDSRTSACDFSGPWCEVGRTSCFPRCGSAAGERAPRAGRRVPEPVRAGASPPRVTACHPGNGRPAASSPERRLLLSRARPEARAGRPVLQGVGADWEPRPSRAAQGTVRARQEGPEAETGSAEGRQQD